MSSAAWDPSRYRQPLWGRLDTVSKNCLTIAAAFGVVVVAAVLFAPAPPVRELTIQNMPERFARLILEEPAAAPEKARPIVAAIEAPAPATVPPPAAVPPPARKRAAPVTPRARPVERRQAPKAAADKGQVGRRQAESEVAANLSEVSGSLNKALAELSQALPAAGRSDPQRRKPRRSRRGSPRTGRAATQLAAVDNIADLAQADLDASQLATEGISITAITDLARTGDTSAGSGASAGQAGSAVGPTPEIRSNQSLLAVVRRYAPGIQFCYENELKKSPGLSGKLVVSLTVAADGTVENAALVADSLNSPAVTDCVMAQMRGWKFPAVKAGSVTFKTPFVFTPPG